MSGGDVVEQLGERIKRLRKERKMTLADVAGDRLTKGMLSLIENGKANPSMESLQYIASQLNINTSELMQSEDSSTIRELLLIAENLYKESGETFSLERIEEIKKEFMNHLQPFFENRSVTGSSFEEVRLYDIYLKGKYAFNKEYNVEETKRLAKYYEDLHAFTRVLSIYSFMCTYEFRKLNYHEALSILLEGERKLNEYDHLIDTLEKLDYYYSLTVVYAATNDNEKTEHYLNLAMELSKKKKIFYRYNDFHRFLYYVNLQRCDIPKMDYYIRKMTNFVQLMEDPLESIMVDIIKLTYYNVVEKDYEKVINFTFNDEEYPQDLQKAAQNFINSERAYAYYHLNDIENAIEMVKDIKIPEENAHPIDLAFLYQGFAVRALCQYEMGQAEEAKMDILYAYNGVKTFSDSIQRDFIVNGYEKIMNEKM
jgi:transcriptional regulator with XRE-family HTH domain